MFVTIAGVYTIATRSEDGFSFAATGEFLSSGGYLVELVASGTPTESGVFKISTKNCWTSYHWLGELFKDYYRSMSLVDSDEQTIWKLIFS